LLDAFIIHSLILIIDTFISYDYAFNGKMEGYGHAEGERVLGKYACHAICVYLYVQA